jgi:hypothetical protein
MRRGLLVLGLLALTAGSASAQLIFDGNILYNNRVGMPAQTLNDQFLTVTPATAACPVGYNTVVLGTSTFTHNSYANPLLPNAAYQTNVVPNFQPLGGSPALGSAVTLPNDGFFQQVCYKGAIGTGADWTAGWTYYDSTGANRQDLHLAGMPNPRPLATYNNVDITSASQYFGPDSNYRIIGQLRVLQGAVLTIAPGVVIFEDEATVGTIIVRRGGKIFAVGTACDPIIITTTVAPGSMRSGQCGGLYLLGRAKMNPTNTCAGDSVAAEGGTVGYFGGNDDSDGSGVLRYVRIEFAGKERSPNNELNAFTFCGVGDRTKGDYLQAFAGDDDGFEWFGGKMDSKHLIAIDGHDDGYDTQLGARTRSQFVIVRMSPGKSLSGGQFGDKGIEADNTETAPFDQLVCAGRSFIQIANATFVGDQRLDDGTLYPGPAFGVHWRRGTSYTLLNSIIMNYKAGALGVEHDATWNAHCAAIPADRVVFCGPQSPVGVEPLASGTVFLAFGAPNPFRDEVSINFSLPESGPVSVDIYSADGRHIQKLAEGELPAGPNRLRWQAGKGTPAGMYFYKVVAGVNQATGKITRVN